MTVARSAATEWRLTTLEHLQLSAGDAVPDQHPWLWILVAEGVVGEGRDPDDSIRLGPGDAAWFGPGTTRQLIARTAGRAIVADLRPGSGVGAARTVLLPGFADHQPGVARLINSCPLTPKCNPAEFSTAYAQLVGAAIGIERPVADGSDSDPAVTQLIEQLVAEPGADWSLARMAAVAHLSRSALAERFRRAAGSSPMELLRELRMAEARILLQEPHWSIGRIASLVGYGSTAAFSRAFAAHHGIGPQQWRSRTFGAAEQTEAQSPGQDRHRGSAVQDGYAVAVQ